MLAAYRGRRGWSQEDLARRSGMSVRAIRDLERGHVRRPRPASIALLADALGLTEVQRNDVADAAGAPSASMPPGWAVPAQLPAAAAAFTGRLDELAALDAVLRGQGGEGPPHAVIAAVTGSAGVGKTALAVQWAHRVREEFPGGQLFIDLDGYARGEIMRPVEALACFLQALGVPGEKVPTETAQAAGLYRTLLAGRRMLVVLDNARSPEQVRPLLPGDPCCRVVVTSRDRLTGLLAREGAHLVRLDVLPPPEARLLLACTAGRERVDAEPDAAAELAWLCAYLPLALRIAAARLVSDPRSIASHVTELAEGNRLSYLEADGDEQAAVRSAFGLSYGSLRADARRLFRLLGLVPGAEVTRNARRPWPGSRPGMRPGCWTG